MLAKDQYDNLLEYYPKLKSAKYSKCIIISHNDMMKILVITYGDHYRDSVNKNIFSCGHCKLKELTKICTLIEDYEKRTSEYNS